MKRNFGIIFLAISTAFSLPLFAETKPQINPCLANIDKHIVDHETMQLNGCKINDTDIPFLTAYLDQHPNITQLYLVNNQIGDEGAILLSKNKNLKIVELRNNTIDKKGAMALAKSSIQTLALEGNKFDEGEFLMIDNGQQKDNALIVAQQTNKEEIIVG